MTDYTKTTDFTSKDSLPSGDSGKIIRGAEFGTEFDNIQTAVNSKSNKENPSFTGNITVTGTVDGRDISADGTKLDTIETSADVTDTANVTAAGAVMDSELTDITAVKALNQGVATTDSPTFADVTSTGNVTVTGTVDGRDVATDGTKLDTVETNADVTDTTNVTAAGALMDSEVTNLAQVKAFDSADYATAAQGTTADNALPKTGGAMTGAITTNSTFDGRDVATDGTKLDGIEASADVTDTTNVTAAGALMDSELTDLTAIKSLDQGVATTDSPTFAGLTTTADVSFGDNDKAIFGAGSDLQIYHDGSNSFIKDTGVGDLYIFASDALKLVSATGEGMATFNADGDVSLRYDNSVKLATTSTGIDVTGNATFDDNGKAIFGAGDDLQIYHDGSNSYIDDGGTGNLRVRANSLELTNADYTQSYLQAVVAGPVSLFHNGSARLATSSTGIDVTGTVVSDGLTVDGVGTVSANTTSNAGSIYNANTSGTVLKLRSGSVGGTAAVLGVFDGNNNEQARFTASGRLGVGTSSPSGLAHLSQAGGADTMLVFENTLGTNPFQVGQGNDDSLRFYYNASEKMRIDSSGLVAIGTSSPVSTAQLTVGGTSRIAPVSGNGLLFASGGSDRMFISTAGNVGIGTSSPDALLEVAGTTNDALLNLTGAGTNFELRATSGNGATANSSVYRLALDYLNGTYTNSFIDFYRGSAGNDGYLAFGSTGTERMRIDSSGNLLVGTTNVNPAANNVTGHAIKAGGLVEHANSGAMVMRLNRTDSSGSIIEFRQGTSAVGSIGTASSRIYIGTDDTGLRFTNDEITPFNPSVSADRNGTVDLGGSSTRFKDLYLSANCRATSFVGIDDNDTLVRMGGSNVIQFFTANSERARFDASGNLLVGTTSGSGHKIRCVATGSDRNLLMQCANGGANAITLNTSGTADYTAFLFTTDGGNTQSGSIVVGASATAYNTSSDQRLKENIVDAPSASDDIDAIQVRSFNWKADGSHQKYGMVAQELQSVALEAVTGDADSDDMMGVDYSKLVPMLVKEIQSLRARVAQLETN